MLSSSHGKTLDNSVATARVAFQCQLVCLGLPGTRVGTYVLFSFYICRWQSHMGLATYTLKSH